MSNHKNVQEIVAELSAKAAEKALQDKNDAIVRFYASMFDKAAAYTNLLVGLGYGGAFATWSATKSYLSPRQTLASGLALFFSLFCFIAWQVFFMLRTAWDLKRLQVLVNASIAEFPKVKAAEELREANLKYRLRLLYFLVLILTVVPGFGGGLILMYAFVRRRIG